jgi:mRNA interferase MazF
VSRRGEVWLVDLDPTLGHEQAGKRPAVVLSVDPINAAGIATVLPITSRQRPLPSRIEVRPPEGGLSNVSYVICEQPRAISTGRLRKRFGALSPATMHKISDAVRIVLGL